MGGHGPGHTCIIESRHVLSRNLHTRDWRGGKSLGNQAMLPICTSRRGGGRRLLHADKWGGGRGESESKDYKLAWARIFQNINRGAGRKRRTLSHQPKGKGSEEAERSGVPCEACVASASRGGCNRLKRESRVNTRT